MQRRFTTESAVLPQWNGFNQQPLKQTEQLDILSSVSLNMRFVLALGWRDRDVRSKVKLNIRLSSLLILSFLANSLGDQNRLIVA